MHINGVKKKKKEVSSICISVHEPSTQELHQISIERTNL
jgi:hypothetical protein